MALNSDNLPRIAVIGCGAAAREFFLPALRSSPQFAEKVTLVDQSQQQVEATANEFGLKRTATDFRSVANDVDAAIIATPHRYHCEQSIFLLEHGVHVLVEKPLGMSHDEAARMVQAARSHDRILSVNNYRRLFPAYQTVRELLTSRELGELRAVTIRDGTKFAWQSVSGFYVRDPAARGVLLDRGAHTLDILCWWLGSVPQVVSVECDTISGVEALAHLHLVHDQTPIDVMFSRMHRLANVYTIECVGGTIHGRLFDFAQVTVSTPSGQRILKPEPPQPYDEYARRLVTSFLQAVQHGGRPQVLAEDVAPSLQLMDAAYASARVMTEPWYTSDPNVNWLASQSPTFGAPVDTSGEASP
ncbi:MAG: Gfo/Idh/MocA family oxidoreductase [Planctomycetales bacterium]|nr:Gfo/Idh/MocA family oxidoreductase [Planctomycetales bacterium]